MEEGQIGEGATIVQQLRVAVFVCCLGLRSLLGVWQVIFGGGREGGVVIIIQGRVVGGLGGIAMVTTSTKLKLKSITILYQRVKLDSSP